MNQAAGFAMRALRPIFRGHAGPHHMVTGGIGAAGANRQLPI